MWVCFPWGTSNIICGTRGRGRGRSADVAEKTLNICLAVVNVARKVGVDAENALIDATSRFQRRFEAVEDGLTERGKTPQGSTLEEMDALWEAVKRRERQA